MSAEALILSALVLSLIAGTAGVTSGLILQSRRRLGFGLPFALYIGGWACLAFSVTLLLTKGVTA